MAYHTHNLNGFHGTQYGRSNTDSLLNIAAPSFPFGTNRARDEPLAIGRHPD